MTAFTELQILDMAVEIAEDHPGHNGLKLTISRETLADWLDLDEWVETFNEDEDSGAELAEEVADIIRHQGAVTTRLEAEVERDGEKFLMTWVPENVSWAYSSYQWAFAFDNEDNPPHDGQIHVETGDRQAISQMAQVDSLEELSQGYYHLQPLNED